ncbi:unnamed protein product [Calypogeia fissa]
MDEVRYSVNHTPEDKSPEPNDEDEEPELHISYECLPWFPFVPREAKGIMDLMGDKPWVRRRKKTAAGQTGGLSDKNPRSASAPLWAIKKKRIMALGDDGGGGNITTTRQALARSVDSLLRTPRRRSNTNSPTKRYSTLNPLKMMSRGLPGDGDHDLWQLLDSMDKSVGNLFPQFSPPASGDGAGPSSFTERMVPPVRTSGSSRSTFRERVGVNRRFNPHVFESCLPGDL